MSFWPFNTDLTNIRIIQENEAGEKAKYLSLVFHDKLTSNCFYLFLCQKKQVKDNLTPYIVQCVCCTSTLHVGYSERLKKKQLTGT